MIYHIKFRDGVHVTIDEEENVTVNEYSNSDVEFNSVANKAMLGDETNYLRLLNIINHRLHVEAV